MTQLPPLPPRPANLPARYEIRRITPEYHDWALAIVVHSNLYHSTVFPVVYPYNRVERTKGVFETGHYLISHQIESGHSFGIWDTEYEYRTPEAKAAGGKLLWDYKDPNATGQQMLEQMDFPLVTVAMAYDGFNALDMTKMAGIIGYLPIFGTVYHGLEVRDPRPPETWKATGPNQVLLRNATSSKHDYEGKGLMKILANYLMRYAADQGFRGIQIECLADAVIHVWSNPPAPFNGKVVSEFNSFDFEEEGEDGKKVNPFQGPEKAPKQRCAKVWCALRGDGTIDGSTNGVTGVAGLG